MSFQAQTEQTCSGYESNAGISRGALESVGGPSPGRPLPPWPGSPSHPAYVFAGNPHTASSRIRPANDRGTSGNDGELPGIETAGHEADPTIFAGSEIGPENTLKVE